MRIMVTGACGFVGMHTVWYLEKQGHEVLPVDINVQNNPIIAYEGDCANPCTMAILVSDLHPEVIIHLAAMSLVPECNEHPFNAFEINVRGVGNILYAAKQAKVKRFIFVSSSSVYGDFLYEPADEIHPTLPKGIYGGQKLAGEILTKTFCEQYGIEWSVARLSSVYGEYGTGRRVVQAFLEDAMAGKPIRVNGSKQFLDFTYVKDVAQGLNLLATNANASNQIFNITRGRAYSLKDLALLVKELISDTRIIEDEINKDRSRRGALDIRKACNLLGYKPSYALDEGLFEYYKWMKK